MAHELEMKDGRASFFEVGQQRDAWHREGVLLAEAPTLEEALKIGRLDFEVKKYPTYRVIGDDKQIVENTKAFVTVRTDTGAELGSVGPDYTVLQNIDAFAALVPLLDAGIIRLETGGVLRDGADVWLLAQFDITKFGPVVREVFADEVIPFALISNNHAGRRNATVALTPIRVVCANTLGMVESDIDGGQGKTRSIGVRHTGDAAARVVEASQQLLGGVIERYEVVAKQYRLLKNFYLDEQMFVDLAVIPAIGVHPTERKNWNPDARMATAVIERWEKKLTTIRSLWTGGKGHSGDMSGWEAYNAVVEAVDHDTDLFPTKSGVYRTASMMHGVIRDMKQAALVKLVGAASGNPVALSAGDNELADLIDARD